MAKRLASEEWIVVLKTLVLLHTLILQGDLYFCEIFAQNHNKALRLANFRDDRDNEGARPRVGGR